MTEARTAMVLAAGLGERMRPLTLTMPKPLVTLAGRALLDHVLDRLAASGVKTAVVNIHYFPDQLEAHLDSRRGRPPETIISDERGVLLNTGGGTKTGIAFARSGSLLHPQCRFRLERGGRARAHAHVAKVGPGGDGLSPAARAGSDQHRLCGQG